MRRSFIALGLLCSMLLLTGATTVAPRAANGTGSFNFGDHFRMDDEGVGTFTFEISRGRGGMNGSLQFAAEHVHGSLYPDIVVRVHEIPKARIRRQTVSFHAKGFFHDEEVEVEVEAFDGRRSNEHDHFKIKCTSLSGEVLLLAHGNLHNGDISVGADE